MINPTLQESREAMANGQWKEARHLLEHELQQNPSGEIFELLASTLMSQENIFHSNS